MDWWQSLAAEAKWETMFPVFLGSPDEDVAEHPAEVPLPPLHVEREHAALLWRTVYFVHVSKLFWAVFPTGSPEGLHLGFNFLSVEVQSTYTELSRNSKIHCGLFGTTFICFQLFVTKCEEELAPRGGGGRSASGGRWGSSRRPWSAPALLQVVNNKLPYWMYQTVFKNTISESTFINI